MTHEERYAALEIIRKTAAKFKRDLWVWSIADGVRDGAIDGGPCIADTDVPAAGLLNLSQARPGLDLRHARPGPDHLKSGKALRILRDLVDNFHKTGITIVMIDSAANLPDVIKTYARPFEISYPDEQELQQIIKATLQRLHRKKPIEVGITQRGLDTIVRNLQGADPPPGGAGHQRRGGSRPDLQRRRHQLDHRQQTTHDPARRPVEYIQTPLDLDEIGGMSNLKKWLNHHRKDVFSPEAKAFGIVPPKGVLMLGVQGAGKSLCAKAIATAWQQPLLRLDPSTLYANYIGESEKNLREALRQTEMMAPVSCGSTKSRRRSPRPPAEARR